MADYSYDVSNRNNSIYSEDYDAYVNRWAEQEKLDKLYADKGTLDFADMLQLMVAQFQNQTIDNQADTNDMMNQLVQMSTMQAMNQMVDSMGELQLASVMSYAASLVGQDVTLFDGYDSDGNMIERVGKVTGMGTYGGQQVIFVDGKDMYYLSSILAVGKLPPKETEIKHAEDCEDENCKGECLDKEIKHAEGCEDENCKGECIDPDKEIKHAEDCDNEDCKGECIDPENKEVENKEPSDDDNTTAGEDTGAAGEAEDAVG